MNSVGKQFVNIKNADNVSINISSSENVSKVIVNYYDNDSEESMFNKNQP